VTFGPLWVLPVAALALPALLVVVGLAGAAAWSSELEGAVSCPEGCSAALVVAPFDDEPPHAASAGVRARASRAMRCRARIARTPP
jgi:hypothetical protein